MIPANGLCNGGLVQRKANVQKVLKTRGFALLDKLANLIGHAVNNVRGERGKVNVLRRPLAVLPAEVTLATLVFIRGM